VKHTKNEEMLKEMHFGMRLTTAEAKLIDKAAMVERRPRSQFIVKAALDKAGIVLGEVDLK